MKRNLLNGFAAIVMVALFMTGCSKDDTTSPIISLNGDASVTIGKGDSYSDAGATANDDQDGSVSVTSTASATNPDVNTPGVYTITYNATDKAGNVASATRTVIVNWKGTQLATFGYTKIESDSANGIVLVDTVAATVTATSASEYRFLFTPMFQSAFTHPIECDVTDGTDVSIAAQYPDGSGSDYLVEGIGKGSISKVGTQIHIDFAAKVTEQSTGTTAYCTIHATSN